MKGEVRIPIASRGTLRRIAFAPIAGYVGYNGMGKSLAAAATAMVHLEAGRPVLSTMRILDYENPRPCEDDGCTWPGHGLPGHMQAHPLWLPLVDYPQLFLAQDCHVLLDEVTGVADAREHLGMPVQVANFLPQLRRRGCTLAWTTINWTFADVRIRRVTQAVVYSSGLRPVYQPDALWPENRLFLWRTYSARDFDEFQSHKREKFRAMARIWFWRPGSVIERAYDTHDQVLALGAVNDAGMCLACGGKRTAPRCSCQPEGRKPVPAARKREDDGSRHPAGRHSRTGESWTQPA